MKKEFIDFIKGDGQGKDIILIYNEDILINLINEPENKCFLSKLGYTKFHNIESILSYLQDRYNKYHCPHEIGIFLGIPLPDVEAFMNCNEKQCLLCGYWKVFSDEEKAKKIFKIYDWSKEMVINYSLLGKDITWIANYLKINKFVGAN